MLQVYSYDKTVVRKFDNADLWSLFCDVAMEQEGDIEVFTLKVHIMKGDCRRHHGLKEIPKQMLPPNKCLSLSAKTQCLCKLAFRLKTETSRMCLGYCRGCSVKLGEIEDNFLSLCIDAFPIPGVVIQTLQ